MPATYIHPTAIVDSREIGAGTRIWAFAHILEGAVIGCNCNIADRVFVEGGGRIGDNVTVKNNVCVWQGITIEDDVFVGPNVTFTNDRYPRSPRMPEVRHRYAETHRWLESTVLRRGCSVGANATVLPGIELASTVSWRPQPWSRATSNHSRWSWVRPVEPWPRCAAVVSVWMARMIRQFVKRVMKLP